MSTWSMAVRLDAELGEGLHWDSDRGLLWAVDIVGQRLMAWTPGARTHQEWRMPQRLGWVLPVRSSQHLVLGLQQGVALLDPISAPEVTWICRFFGDRPTLRLNDAKADSSGAVWAGSLNHDDESRPDGGLYRVDLTMRTAELVDAGYQVANGPAIHPGEGWMLHTDSGRRTVYAFDLDVPAGRLHGKRVWKQLSEAEGFPDGMTFDAEGCVWMAHWGAGCISRFSPEGELLRRVHLPVSNVTNVCFGGPALDRLFVSSARAGLSHEQRTAQPLAGALFEVDAQGVCGLPGREAAACG